MKLLIRISIFLFAIHLQAQDRINNDLLGFYKATDDAIYEAFEFDGNGKVIIHTGITDSSRPFFTTNDSLIIYPDKSIFIFKVSNDTLYGTSKWVEHKTWVKQDTAITSNRTDNAKALKIAQLMSQYHNLKKDDKYGFRTLNDTVKLAKFDTICNGGIAKACMDMIGFTIIKTHGLLTKKTQDSIKPINPKIVNYAKKAFDLGEIEALSALGSYYMLTGHKEKAIETYQKGKEAGSINSALVLYELEEAEKEKTKED